MDRSQYIDAFWAVYTINVYLAVIQGPGAMYSLDYHTVDVPWPLEKKGSEVQKLSLIHAAVDENQERSTTYFNTEFLRLDTFIMEFQRALTSFTPSQTSTSPSSVYLYIATQMLVCTALIKLHSPFVSSLEPGRFGPARQQGLHATKVIADLTRTHLVYGSESSAMVADPVIGLAWTAVYEFFLLLAGSFAGTDSKDDCSLAAFEAFDTILNSFSVYSEEVPLLSKPLFCLSISSYD
ncbi:hypothetical protein H0H81_004015 [Sphagnurus paluster]|uniref:Transcription factor domain-containing protein n=1 Tax=Sphagnurus paluster TaxID=117069 RepID=A0A9P7GT68_9AGAR|nr:hypothetical protein H0H81_004015 [Sphagnurus paluster]